MKKCLIVLFLLSSLIFCGCEYTTSNYRPKENPVRYYKDIDVVVVSTQKKHTLAKIPRYYQSITVKSEEYGLEKIFDFSSSGVFASMPYWDLKEGDVVKAELYSYKMESTGEIIERSINQLR